MPGFTPGGPNGYAVAQEYDDDDNLLREFIHRNGHLRPVAMVDYTDAGAQIEGVPETFWYMYDERGSVVAITDNAGAVVEQYRYDPYGGATVYDAAGNVVASWTDPNSWDDFTLTPSTIGNPYGFTGHRFSVAGLYEAPFRAYSPELGRWLQRDPLGYVDGMNLYQYVLSKPMLLIDPFGLEWMDGVKSFAREVDAAAVRVLDRTAEAMVGAWDAGISAVSDPGGTAKAVHDGVFNGIATAEQDLIASYHKFTASGNSWFDAGTGAFADVFLEEGLAPVFDSVDGYTINSDVPEAGALGSAIGDVAYEILEGAVGGKVAGKAGRLVKSCDPPNSVPRANGPGKPRTRRNAGLAGKNHPVTGIPFDKDGYPDFSGVAVKQVDIELTGDRGMDELLANEAGGFYDGTPDGYTWHHHQNRRTMQLVPTEIHRRTGHDGGYSGR